MLKLIKKIFGTAQSRQVHKYKKIVQQVNLIEEGYQSLSDNELRFKTEEFKERLQNGEPLDNLIPEAFAVVKNACRRMVGTQIHVSGYDQKWDMIPYDVQIIGALALHYGSVAEMQTGEGKTLTAVMPLYLNSLTQKPVHLVTVNDYLVKRDCEWMGFILKWLGIRCAALTSNLSTEEKREIYKHDIVYGTASEFGFDYLRDNSMALHANEQVQRGFYYAIVDEIDSILIDEARTPLIISGPVAKSQQLYHELKDSVSQIVKMQRDLCNSYATEAKRLLDQSGYQLRADEQTKKSKEEQELIQQAIQKLWIVSKGTPRNNVLKKILEDPDLRTRIDELDIFYYSEQNRAEKAKILSGLYVIVDEKASEYELTDKGILTWSKVSTEGSFDDFTMLDLGPLYAEIEHHPEWSNEEKLQRKTHLQEQDAQKKERAHNLRQMLRAHLLMEKDVDYIIQEDAVVIIDEHTGRPQPGRRFSDGLHQAIEAKEEVEIQKETQTYATITLQNYFRLYTKLAGMTGTAITEAGEFKEIYKMNVLAVPTHKVCQRKDANDEIYMTEREKYNAILKEIKEVHEKGRPILIGTESVDISEKLSRILRANKLPHTVLNAKHHEKEAEIIAEAGKLKAITIATNMAGRGTDIKLSKEVIALGGLHVIGTCRHQSRRIDRQLRGRCARQGDPGSSKFYVSFEDQLMRLFASPKLNAMIKKWRPPEGEAISAGILNKSIETAQKRIEQRNYTIRKYTLEYDDVINKQRQEIYRFRNEILTTEEAMNHLREILEQEVEHHVQLYFHQKDKSQWNVEGLYEWLANTFPVTFTIESLKSNASNLEQLQRSILKHIHRALALKMNDLQKKALRLLPEDANLESTADILNQAIQNLMIQTIDEHWQQHLLAIDYLRAEVSLRSVGNKDPLLEFKQESFKAFESMVNRMHLAMLKESFKLEIMTPEHHSSLLKMLGDLNFQTQRSLLPDFENEQTEEAEVSEPKLVPLIREDHTQRNEPCPCGSGKKFKKCCGAQIVHKD